MKTIYIPREPRILDLSSLPPCFSTHLCWASIVLIIVCRNHLESPCRPSGLPSYSDGFSLLVHGLLDAASLEFNCPKWNSGRQPGTFRRVMTFNPLSVVTDKCRNLDHTEKLSASVLLFGLSAAFRPIQHIYDGNKVLEGAS